MGPFWKGSDILYAIYLPKPCMYFTVCCLWWIVWQERKNNLHEMNLITDINISCKLKRRCRKTISTTIAILTSLVLFKTLDFSSLFTNAYSLPYCVLKIEVFFDLFCTLMCTLIYFSSSFSNVHVAPSVMWT